MRQFKELQKRLFEKFGHDVAPFNGDTTPLFAYIEGEKFVFLDKNAKTVSRHGLRTRGNILVGLNDDGYNICQSVSEKGEPILHHHSFKKYYILWEDNEFTELPYLCNNESKYNQKDTFEIIETEVFFSIKYHKDSMHEVDRLNKKPHLDTIVSRKKGIFHVGVFTYYYKDKIVVYDNGKTIVYNKNLDVLLEKEFNDGNWDRLVIGKIAQKTILLFPPNGTVYDLMDSREIKLYDNERSWLSAMTSDDYLIFYSEMREYKEDVTFEDSSETFVRNTIGQVFDSSFKSQRVFNVFGEISHIEKVGNTPVMVTYTSTYKKPDTENLFNLRSANLSEYDDEIGEDVLVPDITFTYMGFDNLYIGKPRVCPLSVINLENTNENSIRKNKCGIFQRKGIFEYKYTIVVDCKYDNIELMPLKEDDNVYFVGILGNGKNHKFDFYINHEIVFEGVSQNRVKLLRVLDSGYFLEVKGAYGITCLIRNNKVVFTTKFNVVNAYVRYKIDYNDFWVVDEDVYLIVVSRNSLLGLYSSKGKKLLPIEYSTIDIDENFNIVLGKKVNLDSFDDELKKEVLNSMRKGEYMEIGKYSKRFGEIDIKVASVYDNKVYIISTCTEEYYWNDGFHQWEFDDYFLRDDNVPSDWEDYTREDSLYDALGGQMDAIWNID